MLITDRLWDTCLNMLNWMSQSENGMPWIYEHAEMTTTERMITKCSLAQVSNREWVRWITFDDDSLYWMNIVARLLTSQHSVFKNESSANWQYYYDDGISSNVIFSVLFNSNRFIIGVNRIVVYHESTERWWECGTGNRLKESQWFTYNVILFYLFT